MSVKQAYNVWADQYDTNDNRTRDLEAIALRKTLANIKFGNCLEIGCGTGKNTEWLVLQAEQVVAIDFSEEMLAKARNKINASNVEFIQADITTDWTFANKQYDLITFSLVLEHTDKLNDIFKKAANVAGSKGFVYVGELHPFKQYNGTKARFYTEAGQQTVMCFTHHISDFTTAAKSNGFEIVDVVEYFDDNDRATMPRILTLLFKIK